MSHDRAETEGHTRRALARQAVPVPSERLFVSPQEVAGALGMDERTVRRAVAAGLIPGFKVGVCWRIPASWLRGAAGLGSDGAPAA
jgi:excisionase family DNA binding protein